STMILQFHGESNSSVVALTSSSTCASRTRAQFFERWRELRGRAGQIVEHPAAPLFVRNARQIALRCVERRRPFHGRREQETTIEVVAPQMVRTAEALSIAAALDDSAHAM